MLAIHCIDEKIKPGYISDDLETLEEKKHSLNQAHLPIITTDEVFLGLIEKNNLEFIKTSHDKLIKAQCFENQHIFEIINIFSSFNTSCIAVTDTENKYLGCLSLQTVMNFIANTTNIGSFGAIITIAIKSYDYSLIEIIEIIESNGAKATTFYSETTQQGNCLLTIKINSNETVPICEALNRYGYTVVSQFANNDIMSEFYDDRINEFFKYLNM